MNPSTKPPQTPSKVHSTASFRPLSFYEKLFYWAYQLMLFFLEGFSRWLLFFLNLLCRISLLDRPILEKKKWYIWLVDRNSTSPLKFSHSQLQAQPNDEIAKVSGSQTVWIHFSSGEFQYARPLIETLLEHPNSDQQKLKVLATYFSPSAKPMLERFTKSLSPDNQSRFVFLPLPWDRSHHIKKLIAQFQPCCLLIARSELWPAQILESHQLGVPILFFSATKTWTLSQPLSTLQNILLKRIDEIQVVSASDAENFKLQIGHKAVPRIKVCGDTRAQALIHKTSISHPERPYFFLTKTSEPLKLFKFVMASTWPQDEKALKTALTLIQIPKLSLLQIFWAPHEVYPHHQEQGRKWAKDLDVKFYLWSDILSAQSFPKGPSFVLIDSVGHLFHLYPEMDLAFVGGSFHKKVHNVLEPLVWGTPVLVGPKIQNSREALELLALHPKTEDLALASFLPLEKANTSEELSRKLNLRIETFFETKPPALSSFRASNREAILNLGGGVLSAFEWVKSKLD